jgi:hypothetical protein
MNAELPRDQGRHDPLVDLFEVNEGPSDVLASVGELVSQELLGMGEDSDLVNVGYNRDAESYLKVTELETLRTDFLAQCAQIEMAILVNTLANRAEGDQRREVQGSIEGPIILDPVYWQRRFIEKHENASETHPQVPHEGLQEVLRILIQTTDEFFRLIDLHGLIGSDLDLFNTIFHLL